MSTTRPVVCERSHTVASQVGGSSPRVAATTERSSAAQPSSSASWRIAQRYGTSSVTCADSDGRPSNHGQRYSSTVCGRTRSGGCMWPSTNGTCGEVDHAGDSSISHGRRAPAQVAEMLARPASRVSWIARNVVRPATFATRWIAVAAGRDRELEPAAVLAERLERGHEHADHGRVDEAAIREVDEDVRLVAGARERVADLGARREVVLAARASRSRRRARALERDGAGHGPLRRERLVSASSGSTRPLLVILTPSLRPGAQTGRVRDSTGVTGEARAGSYPERGIRWFAIWRPGTA